MLPYQKLIHLKISQFQRKLRAHLKFLVFLVLDWIEPFKCNSGVILSIMTTCNFEQYIVLHHLDDKNHISVRLGKQKISILSSYGHLFWQFPQKCTLWDF